MPQVKRLLVVLAAVLPVALFAQQADSTVYKPGDGVSLPSVVKEVRPQYTSEAMQQRIEGKVGLQCVVRPDGKVSDIKVVQSLDSVYGLDRNATEALAQWEFKPGRKDDKPVAVQVEIQMAFTLK